MRDYLTDSETERMSTKAINQWIKWRESVVGYQTSSPAGIFRCLRIERHLPIESSWIFILNRKGVVIRKRLMALGDDRGCPVDLKAIVEYAKSVRRFPILVTVHNHPSGACKPSAADRGIWKELRQLCDKRGVLLLDNMILSRRAYYSEYECGSA